MPTNRMAKNYGTSTIKEDTFTVVVFNFIIYHLLVVAFSLINLNHLNFKLWPFNIFFFSNKPSINFIFHYLK